MRISVIVTTFNGEHFIQEQLQSILEQSRQADEIIIGDDCSTDKTVQIINAVFMSSSFSGKVEIVDRKTNVGLYFNIKDLIKRSAGDIIVLADQDDIWLSDKLSVIEDCFIHNQNIAALLTGFKAIDQKGNLILPGDKDDNIWITDQIRTSGLSQISAADILCRNYGPGCTLAIRKTIAELFLLSENHLIHDWQLCLLAAIQGGLFYNPAILTYYRQHESNTIGMHISFPEEMEMGKWRKSLLFPIYLKYCFFTAKKDALRKHIATLCFPPETVQYYLEKYCIDNIEKHGVNEYYKYSKDYWNAINNHKIIQWFITIMKNKKFRKAGLYTFSYENHLRFILSEVAVILKHY